mmetsp:Transcript_26560/g.64208  ORF Transcript_26560/g.64208 Transcript_26560/m.64208 type:complete len:96 (+) Transcript_26560:651-938(+)
MLGPFVAHFRQKVWQIGSFQSSMPGPTVFYHQDCLVISFRFNTTGRFDGATGTFGEILLKTLRKLTNIALVAKTFEGEAGGAFSNDLEAIPSTTK